MKRLILLVCALAVALPLPAADAGPEQQLDRIQDELERQRELLRRTNRERDGLLDEISEADRRRGDLTAKIEGLLGDLGEAEERLEEAQASLDLARASLLRWNNRLEGARERLTAQQETLSSRAAAAYKMGAAGLVEVILGAEDLRSLTDRVEYVRAVMDSDSYLLRSIQATRVQVAERRDRVADHETVLSKHRDAITREVERIAALKAEQEVLRAEVDAAIDEREQLLEGVEENRQQHVQAVKELEAESERIAGLIRGGGSSGDGNPGAQLFWPAPGPITSGFGWRVHPIFGTRRFHAGVDIDADCGDPIWAAARGNVISAGWNGGYGNATVVDHGNGLATLYAHQESIGVAVGQRVGRGQQIGRVGTTGWSTGCHLHFEVRINGTPVDPAPYLT